MQIFTQEVPHGAALPLAVSPEAWTNLVQGAVNGNAAFDLVVLQEHRVTAHDNTLQYVKARVDAIEDKIRGNPNINNTIQAGFQDNLAAQVYWLMAETCSLKETHNMQEEKLAKQQEEIAKQEEKITKLEQQVASNVEQDSFNAMYAAVKTEIAACYHYLFNGSTIASGDGWVWKADFLRDRLSDLRKSCEGEASKNFEKCKRLEDLIRNLKVELDKRKCTHGGQQPDSHRSMASNAMQDASSDAEEMQNADISSPSDSGALSCL